MVAHKQKKEDWMNSKWRPAMGWMYMVVCICDFVFFPILWSILQSISHGQVTSQWQPLTLQGAGLFHLAMGAIIGVSAYGRTKEKLGGVEMGMGGMGAAPMSSPAPYTPSFSPQNNNNLNNSPTGFAGKKSPPPAQEPML